MALVVDDDYDIGSPCRQARFGSSTAALFVELDQQLAQMLRRTSGGAATERHRPKSAQGRYERESQEQARKMLLNGTAPRSSIGIESATGRSSVDAAAASNSRADSFE